jgi:formyltetrahydrofolate hydrolase
MAYSPIGLNTAPRTPVRLLISCPDGPGIVDAISRFVFERGASRTIVF